MTKKLFCLLVTAHLWLVVTVPALAPLCGGAAKEFCAMSPGSTRGCCCKLLGLRSGHACEKGMRVRSCSSASHPLEGEAPLQLATFDGRGLLPCGIGIPLPAFAGRLETSPSSRYQPPHPEIHTPPPRLSRSVASGA